jgi:hypothetical protein
VEKPARGRRAQLTDWRALFLLAESQSELQNRAPGDDASAPPARRVFHKSSLDRKYGILSPCTGSKCCARQ